MMNKTPNGKSYSDAPRQGVTFCKCSFGLAIAACCIASLAVSSAFAVGTYTLTVAEGVTNTFAEAIAAKGVAFTDGDDIVKDGLGTLVADGTFADNKINSFTIREGVVVSEHDNPAWFGTNRGNSIVINDGATFFAKGSSCPLLARNVMLAGSGASGCKGAIATDAYCYSSSLTMHLTDDAVIYSGHATDDTAVLRYAEVNFNGHSLTLRSVKSNKGFSIPSGEKFTTRGEGTMVVDGTVFKTSETSVCARNKNVGATATLCLTNGATFMPCSQTAVDLFEYFTATADSTLGSGVSAAGYSFKNWQGLPTVTDSVASLSITNCFKVDAADLKSGKKLSMKGTLTFGPNCAFELLGDVAGLTADEFTVATSDTSVTGVPVFAPTKDNYRWKLVAGADGKSLKIVYDKAMPVGAIDMTSWNVAAGASVVNSAADFNAHVASCAAGAILYFPKGDYYFDAPLEIGAKSGLTICGLDELSVLHVGGAATAVIRATGTSDLTIRRLAFADCSGVAVEASGTLNLTVTNCWYDGIGGAIAGVTGETYPIAVTDAANTFVRCNQTLDGAFYTAHVRLAGTSEVKTGSEPLGDAGFVLCVSPYATDSFADAMARSGRAAYPSGGNARLYKAGQGTLLGSAEYGSLINGITIEEGTYAYSAANELGKAQSPVDVKPGGTLYVMKEPTYILLSRQLTVAGFGAPDRKGAVVFAPGTGNASYSAMSINLDRQDASFYFEGTSDYVAIFRHATLFLLNGARLFLRSASPTSGFRSECKLWTGTGANVNGSLVVDGCTFYVSKQYDSGTHKRGVGSDTALVLTNNATFKAGCAESFVPFGGIVASDGCKISAGASSDPQQFAASIDKWTGCGTITNVLTSLTINQSMTLRADDLKAGRYLSAAGEVAFAGGSLLKLENGAALEGVGDPLTFVTAAAGVTGRPRRDMTGSDFGRRTIRATSDGKSLYLDRTGFTILVH